MRSLNLNPTEAELQDMVKNGNFIYCGERKINTTTIIMGRTRKRKKDRDIEREREKVYICLCFIIIINNIYIYIYIYINKIVIFRSTKSIVTVTVLLISVSFWLCWLGNFYFQFLTHHFFLYETIPHISTIIIIYKIENWKTLTPRRRSKKPSRFLTRTVTVIFLQLSCVMSWLLWVSQKEYIIIY